MTNILKFNLHPNKIKYYSYEVSENNMHHVHMDILTQRASHLQVVYTVFYTMLVLRNFWNMKTNIQVFHYQL